MGVGPPHIVSILSDGHNHLFLALDLSMVQCRVHGSSGIHTTRLGPACRTKLGVEGPANVSPDRGLNFLTES